MRGNLLRCLVLLVIAGLAVGCGAMQAQSTPPPPMAESDMGAPAGVAPPAQPETASRALTEAEVASIAAQSDDQGRMIVYSGNLSLVVADSENAYDQVLAITEGAGGYVADASSYAYSGGLRRMSLTLRVPAEAFNATMDAFRGLALEIPQDSINSEDVTQEYVDLGSRLTALEAKAARLEILMDQAEDTESVLAVYQELSQTQIDIEQTKGRMRYLERSSAMATITVELVPDELSQPVEVAGWRPQGTVKRAVEALITAFQFLVNALIWIVLLVIPVLAFIGLVIYGIIRLLGLIFGRGRRRKAREQAEAAKASEGPVAPEPPQAG